MKTIYWIGILAAGAFVAWFLWRKVDPEGSTETKAHAWQGAPTDTVTDESGNIRAVMYKAAPNAGLLGMGIDNITIIEGLKKLPRVATN